MENREKNKKRYKKISLAEGLNGYKLIWIFILCSVLGYMVEMGWCYLYHGFFESRKSLLYGPFSIIYGVGGVMIMILVHKLRNQSNLTIFTLAAVFGVGFEYLCSVLQELVFGSVSWDYSGKPFTIQGRASLLFSIGWGLLAILFLRVMLPRINRLLEALSNQRGRILTWGFAAFLVFDIVLSASAVWRQNQRREGLEPANGFELFLDHYFPDQKLNQIYANMRIAGTKLVRDANGRVVK